MGRESIKGKQTEALIQDHEKSPRDLFEEAPMAYFTVGADRAIKDCNRMAQQLVGYTAEALIGKDIAELIGDSQGEKGVEIWKRLLSGNGVVHSEVPLVRQGGSVVWGSVALSQIKDKKGKTVGCRCMMCDITDHVTHESQLQQAAKMEAVGTLAGGIAHDFNNLLMGIQGNVSLILMDTDAAHPHYQRLKNIEKQVESGARLTSNLLGYARKGRYEVTPMDLNGLALEVSYTFERTRREITIRRELAPGLPPVEADRGQIAQVLLNLFVNASDAMPNGGNILLGTENATYQDIKGKVFALTPGDYVLLRVTDTGIGMDQNTMERIFDPFFTTKEMGRGTGLGLASAYGIVKGHRGHIFVDSQKEGGTTFSVYLPVSPKQIHQAVATAGEAGKWAHTVLLVDDEKIVLEVGRELLEAMGYRVISAADGKEAVAIYERRWNDIDIVLLDMVMPHVGGGEAYDRMKEINPKIKVILSTGYSVDGQAAEILQRGCDAFIQKPFSLEELSKKLTETLDHKEARA